MTAPSGGHTISRVGASCAAAQVLIATKKAASSEGKIAARVMKFMAVLG
jgi:hypothetical protein